MTMAIMQPYIFPYIGYFQLIWASDIFVLYNDVNWINRGWINRNRILTNNGTLTFTVPCKDASQNRLINEIEVILDERTIQKLLKTFQMTYQKAPYFKIIFPLLEDFFNLSYNHETIDQAAKRSIEMVLDYIGISKNLKISSRQYPDTKGMGKAERLIEICHREKCTDYINAPGGKSLYDKIFFGEQGINLSFLESKKITYAQFEKPFVPWLSIIDIMMFNKPSEIQQMLTDYELV